MKTDVQDEQQSRAQSKPTRHAMIMRGIVTPIFGLLAVACIVFGIVNQTIWAPSKTVDATAKVDGTQYVVTDPGVLNLVDSKVTLGVRVTSTPSNTGTASGEGTEPGTVCIATGSGKDATGWMQGHAFDRITGLKDWKTLDITAQKAEGTPETGDNHVAFKDSDMWTNSVCSKDTASIDLADADSSQVALIDLGSDKVTAEITMGWTRTSVPDFAMPLYVAGGLCAVMAVLCASVFAMPHHKRRKQVEQAAADAAEDQAREERRQEVKFSDALKGSISAIAGPGRKAKDANKPRRRHARRAGETTGTIPVITDGTDPQSAEQNTGDESTTVSDQTTTVITQEELQAYFARLNSELEGPQLLGHIDTGSESQTEESADTQRAQTEETRQSEDSGEAHDKFKPRATVIVDVAQDDTADDDSHTDSEEKEQ